MLWANLNKKTRVEPNLLEKFKQFGYSIGPSPCINRGSEIFPQCIVFAGVSIVFYRSIHTRTKQFVYFRGAAWLTLFHSVVYFRSSLNSSTIAWISPRRFYIDLYRRRKIHDPCNYGNLFAVYFFRILFNALHFFIKNKNVLKSDGLKLNVHVSSYSISTLVNQILICVN